MFEIAYHPSNLSNRLRHRRARRQFILCLETKWFKSLGCCVHFETDILAVSPSSAFAFAGAQLGSVRANGRAIKVPGSFTWYPKRNKGVPSIKSK